MTYNDLYESIRRKGSFLCIGLDPDMKLIPEHIRRNSPDPIFEFNKEIIDATAPYAIAYKPNLAFYEAEGAEGWEQLAMTVDYIKYKDPSLFVIADAKRGDIGNTASQYAKAFFETMDCDAVTLSPYMGSDTVEPFLKYKDKWAIILALTSNPSAVEFETLNIWEHISVVDEPEGMYVGESPMTYIRPDDGAPLYQKVIATAMKWGNSSNTMFVVGANRAIELSKIREYCPNHFLLVPGVGRQGGNIGEVARYGMNNRCGLIVNMSRDIIFAGNGEDFARKAAKKAAEAAAEMSRILSFHQMK
ncbi:MAG: orotidine-5'-phosphate decarboxylase [Bacteroidales bacterium]|nr:orotidine-5'-phosphate decarboxylase [Bacteroidales bacterium]MDD2424674.1 orotidine-5'-phosphate decarboxylase [Bacteroidales bacterium]MDD3989878.1 orotidine-5'-phosphate decarboxylase [Bacteroidales bacterium]MDD4638127.1 orotidine-5'-phosphate decarboxylase [Bacteroidales bacterium]